MPRTASDPVHRPHPSPLGRRVVGGALVALLGAAPSTPGCATRGFFELSAGDGTSQSGDSKTTDASRCDEQNTASQDEGSSHDSSGSAMAVVTYVSALALAGMTVAGLSGVDVAAVEDYLDQNRRPIRVALARGAGLLVDDLATAMSLPGALVPVLGATLHDHQSRLDRWLADAEVSRADVEGFTRDLAAALDSEPRLAPFVAAARVRVANR